MTDNKLPPMAYPPMQGELVDGHGRHLKWLPVRSDAVWYNEPADKPQPSQHNESE